MAGISVAEAGRHKKAPKHLKEMTLSRGAEGHIVAMHHFTHYSHDSEEHRLEPTEEAVGKHVAKHFNLEEQGGSEPEPVE